MTNKRNETALITGASAGIGLALAQVYAREGFDLVLTARSRERLEKLAAELQGKYGTKSSILVHDLSKGASSWEMFAELKQLEIEPDVLVNNAGFGMFGAFSAGDLPRELEMIQLNITSLVQLTKLLLPDMLRKKKGKILNVASTAAFQPGPFMALYYASKAFVLSFSEALFEELRGTGVTVTALCPGPTESEFVKAAGITEDNKVFKIRMTAEKVAELGYRGSMGGKRVVIPGWVNKLTAFFGQHSPKPLVLKIVRRLQETRR